MYTTMPGPPGTLPALTLVAWALPHPPEKSPSLLVNGGFHTGPSILLTSSIRLPPADQPQVAPASCSRATRGGVGHLCSSDQGGHTQGEKDLQNDSAAPSQVSQGG